MTTAIIAASLQDSVDRYARSLIVPSRLLALHPRKAGSAGDAAALAPAIALGVISAFEGFVEDFFATALYLRGQNLAQIAKKTKLNNPDIKVFEQLVGKDFTATTPKIGVGFSIDVWYPPAPESGNRKWIPVELDWKHAVADGQGWMQVRHCLTHGLTSGWRSEVWPGPLQAEFRPAAAVLNPMKSGKHSLVLHGAITCARIYRGAAVHLANLVAGQLDETLSWSKLPDFPMYKTSLEEYRAANGLNEDGTISPTVAVAD
ncbi:hypothetical protein [Nocardia sp.]|uniref:hypothetical protein n=1 Tax=Nocardia sp. TaxID=1821 RepID=UPI00261E6EB6|nr:hypothetical protein [Nocardia sp.]